ncbi:hypothetical protein G5C51_19895 [Streptomyces sp. A7024]|uniref:ATP-dependent DNA helicase RecG n=1 Tax=Streptomyces coryli TaxID=1128680 RepID=A0A6G4U4D6_9ACTN|nr:hypothetical protein [Streptomyces coryli]NGN66147.1 hypothetical protein [Streptomyces coryli]
MRTWIPTALAAIVLGLAAPTQAEPAQASTAEGCDPIDPAACLLPFPNDWFTERDRSTDTGRRVAFADTATPANAAGKHIDPAEWNRSDGFSPGSPILAQVPGLDLKETGAAPLTDIGASLRRDAPVVLLDADTGRRHPYWAELDANATDRDRQALIIRPAENLREGHRYVVALRDLRTQDGDRIAATDTYRKILGRTLPKSDPLAARQAQQRPLLRDLARAGVHRKDLYLAWDFTVASERSLTERMLHIRDDSFEELGGKAPEHLVSEVKENAADDPIAREVRGLFNVPSYLDKPGGPTGSRFHYGSDGLPARLPGNTQVASFQCEIPRSALTKPARPALYGHGLLGREGEVGAGHLKKLAAEHNTVFCATKWIGMSDEDILSVAGQLGDLSGFAATPDRLQQGVLNTLWLGRLLTHEDGLRSADAFKGTLDPGAELGYYGNSQGGIMGGIFTAVSTDTTKSVLGVPAMNYSTLLNRSVDFDPFQELLDQAYPDKLDQQLGFALMQMLWDRGEANGYAAHMTRDPLPGTPRHQVLMHVAYGDHQVSPTAAEVEARTIGARIHTPAVAPGRNPDKVPYWGIRPLREPSGGSGIVIWDSGAPYQPLTNTPPTEGEDPHSDPRNSAAARAQIAEFLATGRIVDVCGDGPCTAAPAP